MTLQESGTPIDDTLVGLDGLLADLRDPAYDLDGRAGEWIPVFERCIRDLEAIRAEFYEVEPIPDVASD